MSASGLTARPLWDVIRGSAVPQAPGVAGRAFTQAHSWPPGGRPPACRRHRHGAPLCPSPQELGASLAQLVVQQAACCLADHRRPLHARLVRRQPRLHAGPRTARRRRPAGPASLARWTGLLQRAPRALRARRARPRPLPGETAGAAGGHAERAALIAWTRPARRPPVISKRPRPPPEPGDESYAG